MRTKIVAGNWKNEHYALRRHELAKSINDFVVSNHLNNNVKVVLGVPLHILTGFLLSLIIKNYLCRLKTAACTHLVHTQEKFQQK
jgi:hypothetical protein